MHVSVTYPGLLNKSKFAMKNVISLTNFLKNLMGKLTNEENITCHWSLKGRRMAISKPP